MKQDCLWAEMVQNKLQIQMTLIDLLSEVQRPLHLFHSLEQNVPSQVHCVPSD